MATTINSALGIPLTVIAQEGLPVLQKMLPKFTAFTYDFSGDAAPVATAVVTRLPGAMTPTAFSAANGYAYTAVSSSAVTINLNNHYHNTVGFTDLELQQGGLPLLMRTFVQPAIFGIVNQMADSIYSLTTASNFPGAVAYTGTTFTFDNFYAGATILDTSGSQGEKNAILNASYYAKLLADVKNNYVIGDSEAIREGVIGNLGGVRVWEAPGYQSTRLPLNENAVGFMCTPSAIAIAARVPQIPSSMGYGEVENLVEPSTGFTIQLRRWYSMDLGQTKFTATAIWGVAVGNSANLTQYRSS